jgi:AcrR family transcriptional regulator
VLRAEIVVAAFRMLDELADDEALSLRAVAREVSIAATSVYLHFPDRDALVQAVIERCSEDMLDHADRAGENGKTPPDQLRGRVTAMAEWAHKHPGLYKVMHESKLNREHPSPAKIELGNRLQAAVERCMDSGDAPRDDPETVTLDLRAAVQGMLSMRVNEPGASWGSVAQQVERFLVKIVGIGSAR